MEEAGKAKNSFQEIRDIPLDEALSANVGGSGNYRVLPRQIGTGTMQGQQNIGGQGVKIDSNNRRIIVNDGTNDRILIGYQENGF